ncbi:putative Uncharacterized J domain-containing protein C2E1P5.03 [Sclerotinia borealis F-4128]|uniref:Putative Uncharacterized J domain-containing protein C2E1P5.03 n=1 Tax=Sclerotinia borealis (strain F-4128) TaxID=1432307 RepID=W9CPK9_SCLBF|nr:putative Uncharacterized J domain-containing protein C2E1P5.03 [Sclerotinia borealis F-4128]
MKGFFYTLATLACLLILVAAWSKEDQEIFRLQNEVATHEGTEVTFYDLFDIKSSANQEEIRAAYKKKSRTLHPDKVKAQFIADKSTGNNEKSKSGKDKKPDVNVSKGPSQAAIKAHHQAASDRFTRLGLINKILLGEGRARYDHFLKNGFPKWKGTGYYYARFRPGFGSVLVGLFVFIGGGGHYLALYLSWRRQREFVERYITFARNSAWGGNSNLNVPGLDGTSTPGTDTDADADPTDKPMNRKQRRMQEKDTKKDKTEKKVKKVKASAPGTPKSVIGPKKRVVAANGKVLIVDSASNVYLEQADEDGKMKEFLLDLDGFPAPAMRDTALFRLPIFAFNKTFGRFLNKTPDEEEYEEVEDSSSSGADDFEVLEKVKTTATNGNGKGTRRNKKNGR